MNNKNSTYHDIRKLLRIQKMGGFNVTRKTDELVIKKPSKTRNQLRDLGNNSLWRKP